MTDATASASTTAVVKDTPCPHCNGLFAKRGLPIHIGSKHAGVTAAAAGNFYVNGSDSGNSTGVGSSGLATVSDDEIHAPDAQSSTPTAVSDAARTNSADGSVPQLHASRNDELSIIESGGIENENLIVLDDNTQLKDLIKLVRQLQREVAFLKANSVLNRDEVSKPKDSAASRRKAKKLPSQQFNSNQTQNQMHTQQQQQQHQRQQQRQSGKWQVRGGPRSQTGQLIEQQQQHQKTSNKFRQQQPQTSAYNKQPSAPQQQQHFEYRRNTVYQHNRNNQQRAQQQLAQPQFYRHQQQQQYRPQPTFPSPPTADHSGAVGFYGGAPRHVSSSYADVLRAPQPIYPFPKNFNSTAGSSFDDGCYNVRPYQAVQQQHAPTPVVQNPFLSMGQFYYDPGRLQSSPLYQNHYQLC